MAGPDLLRPPIEDQLGSGVAGQQKDGILMWNSFSSGGKVLIADGIVTTPDGGSVLALVMLGIPPDDGQIEPWFIQPADSPVGSRV